MNMYVNILDSDNKVVCKLTLPLEKEATIKLDGRRAEFFKDFLKRGLMCRDPETGKMREMTLSDGTKLMSSLFTGLSYSNVTATRAYFDDQPLPDDYFGDAKKVEEPELQKAIPEGGVGMLQLHWRLGRPVHADLRLSSSEGVGISGDRLSGKVEWPIQWVIVPNAADAVLHLSSFMPMISFMKPDQDAASENEEAQEFVGLKKDSLLVERSPQPVVAPFMPGGSQMTPDMKYKQDEHLTERKCKRGNKACKNCGNCPFSKAIKKDNKLAWRNDEALGLVALFKWEPGEQTDLRKEYVIHDSTVPEINGRYAFEKMNEEMWKFSRV